MFTAGQELMANCRVWESTGLMCVCVCDINIENLLTRTHLWSVPPVNNCGGMAVTQADRMLYGPQTKALINYKYQMSGPRHNGTSVLQQKPRIQYHTNGEKTKQNNKIYNGLFAVCVVLL